MAFPTLSKSFLSVHFDSEDNVLASPLEAGYEHRRPRHTRSRKSLTVNYDLLPTADKELLLAHEASVGLATSFDITDSNSNVYTVYYVKKLRYVEFVTGWWKFESLQMREV